MPPPPRRRRLAAALLGAAVLVGCGEAENPQRQPEAVDDGVQATGRIDGQRVAISYGDPRVTLGDCDANDGLDEDLCIVTRTIDGAQVNIVVENPAVLAAGTDIPVRDDACEGPPCDEVTDHAVVDVRADGAQTRADAGRIEVREAGPRYAGDFELGLRGDRLVGSFNVRPGLG